MDILKIIILILHFIGIGALLGSFLVQTKEIARGKGTVLTGMFHGSLLMLVSGLILVVLNEFNDAIEVNHMKVGIKLAVLIAIVVLVLVFRKKNPAPSWVLWLIGGLTVLNIVIAVAM